MTILTRRLLDAGVAVQPLIAVKEFMQIGGQTTDHTNAAQCCLYIGLIAEELAEILRCVGKGAVLASREAELRTFALAVEGVAEAFKAGVYTGEVGACDKADLLDGAVDAAWVSMGAMFSIGSGSLATIEAFREVTRANFDKFHGGVVQRDANGKVVKPEGWRPPDLSPFV